MKKIFIAVILMTFMIIPSTANAKVKIADMEYETLDEAITQVKEGETITLLDDVDVSDINKYKDYFNWLFPDNSTLDLNGHTIFTGFKGGCPNSVWLGNNITIKNGKFETKAGADYALFLGDELETSNITVEDITVSTGINIYNTLNVTLKNVTATGQTYYAVWLDEHATATIESGEFSSNGVATVGITTAKDGFKSELTLKGGIFKGEKGKFSLSEAGNSKYLPPIIKGGTYSYDVSEFVPEDYECKAKDNVFVVSPKEYDREVAVDGELDEIKVKVENDDLTKILVDEVNKSNEVNVNKKDVRVTLNIKDVKPADDVTKKMIEKIKNGEIANYFDISINVIDKSTNSIIGNLTELENKIALSIEIPENLKPQEGYARKYYVLRDHNGVIDVIETKLSEDNKTLTFETDKFSTYALAYEDVEIPKDEEKTDEKIENPATEDKLKYNVILMSGFAVIALGGILYLCKKESLF